jgi:uncharacterized protein
MIKDITSVKIGPVWNAGRGATHREEIEAEVLFPDTIVLSSPLTASLLLIRMKEGVTAVLSGVATSLEQTCSRCLDRFIMDIDIPQMEAHFFDHLSPHRRDAIEQFPIRLKNMSIDLTEAIRQEIILHFPLIPVCSKRCKGLCAECRVNLNHQPHRRGCSRPPAAASRQAEDGTVQPFANLKDYFQN